MMPRVLIASVRRASFMNGQSQKRGAVSIIPARNGHKRTQRKIVCEPLCPWREDYFGVAFSKSLGMGAVKFIGSPVRG